MENYWEGWGFTDRIPTTISATPRKLEILKIELKKSFPDSQIDELDNRNFRFYVREEQLKKLKKFVATLNGKVYYENGGKLDTKKLVYVLYQPTPKGIKILNENGRTYLSWWQSDLNRGDSERLLEKLQIQNLILGGLRYTGDTSDLKFEQGGNIGEVLATSNPYIGGAKVIQGIAPESVSAIDKKMASRINPDPNRPIFFSNGGKTPKLEVGDKVIYPKDPKKRVGFISKITGSGMAFVDFVREGKVELFDLEDLKKTIRIPYSNGGKTPKEKNITNYKKAVESYINDKYKQDVDWSESMILFDDRSEETKIKKAVIVTKQGNEYEVYHDDIFSMFKSGGYLTKAQRKNKVRKVMREFKEGTLFSSSGQKVTDRKQAIAIALSEAGLSKYDNGGTTGSTDYSVAKIILEQLGGQGKLVVMTGAYNFIGFPNGLSFKLKSRKANYVKITLNAMDLYDVQFQKLFGMKSKVVAEYDDLYFDQLIPIIEKETGMYLKLFKKGGFINTQNRDMVISQLKAIHHHEEEMLNTLKKSGEVEAWVLAKVSNASNDLSNVAHYLEFKE